MCLWNKVNLFGWALSMGYQSGKTSVIEQTENKHTSCNEANIMISSSIDDQEEARKKELQNWVENKEIDLY